MNKELDLDALERDAKRLIANPKAETMVRLQDVLALIQRLRKWEEIHDDILLLFTSHDQVPELYKHALTDAPFHAALRIIEIYQERLREAETEIKQLKFEVDRDSTNHNEEEERLEARIAQLERVREIAQKIVNAKRQAAYFSPGDKSQPWLAGQIEEGLIELGSILDTVKKENV